MRKLGEQHATIECFVAVPGVWPSTGWQGVVAVVSVPETVEMNLEDGAHYARIDLFFEPDGSGAVAILHYTEDMFVCIFRGFNDRLAISDA